MRKLKLKNLLGLSALIIVVAIYVIIANNQPKQQVGVRAYTKTTCESLRFKGAPTNMLPTFLEDYKNIYCTDKTPLNGGNGKCYTKTLACSINRLDSPYWCVSASCYACVNEEVDFSLCTAPVVGTAKCIEKDALWKARSYECEYGAQKLPYGQCSSDRYKCKCDNAKKYEYPTAQKDLSCPDVTPRVTCSMKPILLPFLTAYNSGDYKQAYTEMKKVFLLGNTQVPVRETGCYMPKARLITSGISDYCGSLQLDSNLSYGCSCWNLMDVEIGSNPATYDYAKMKEITYCQKAIEEILKASK